MRYVSASQAARLRAVPLNTLLGWLRSNVKPLPARAVVQCLDGTSATKPYLEAYGRVERILFVQIDPSALMAYEPASRGKRARKK